MYQLALCSHLTRIILIILLTPQSFCYTSIERIIHVVSLTFRLVTQLSSAFIQILYHNQFDPPSLYFVDFIFSRYDLSTKVSVVEWQNMIDVYLAWNILETQ